jgi:hypothetical protein
VGLRQFTATFGAADLEDDDRDITHLGRFECRDESGWIAGGFEKATDDAGFRLLHQKAEVIGRGGDELLSTRDGIVEA